MRFFPDSDVSIELRRERRLLWATEASEISDEELQERSDRVTAELADEYERIADVLESPLLPDGSISHDALAAFARGAASNERARIAWAGDPR